MEFWTSFALKSRARQLLRGRWTPYLAITLIFLFITSLVTEVGPLCIPDYNAMSEQLAAFYEDILTSGSVSDIAGATALLRKMYISSGILALASFLYQVFVSNILQIGLLRWYMEARTGTPRPSTLFSGFFNGAQWRNVLKVQLHILVVRFLWSLLFFIPGIIYTYRMWLAPYLLAENPYMPRRRAIELSEALTEGEKLRIFLLELSFVGWYILIGIATGICSAFLPGLISLVTFIGTLLLTVYQQCTCAELYAHMREKAFRMGLTDATELAGFAA